MSRVRTRDALGGILQGSLASEPQALRCDTFRHRRLNLLDLTCRQHGQVLHWLSRAALHAPQPPKQEEQRAQRGTKECPKQSRREVRRLWGSCDDLLHRRGAPGRARELGGRGGRWNFDDSRKDLRRRLPPSVGGQAQSQQRDLGGHARVWGRGLTLNISEHKKHRIYRMSACLTLASDQALLLMHSLRSDQKTGMPGKLPSMSNKRQNGKLLKVTIGACPEALSHLLSE